MRPTRLLAHALTSGAVLATTQARAQQTMEFRLIADGDAGSPTGIYPSYPIGDRNALSVTRIGFWVQARVSLQSGQNYGILRVTDAGTETPFLTVTNWAGTAPIGTIQPGARNAAQTAFGRTAAYVQGAGNGTISPDGHAISNVDAYLGSARTGTLIDDEDPAAGYRNPWGVNGATPAHGTSGEPVALDTFSPWANLYRIWIDNPGCWDTLTCTALVTPFVGTQNIGNGLFPSYGGTPQLMSASYTLSCLPTPSSAAAIALFTLTITRRRR